LQPLPYGIDSYTTNTFVAITVMSWFLESMTLVYFVSGMHRSGISVNTDCIVIMGMGRGIYSLHKNTP